MAIKYVPESDICYLLPTDNACSYLILLSRQGKVVSFSRSRGPPLSSGIFVLTAHGDLETCKMVHDSLSKGKGEDH